MASEADPGRIGPEEAMPDSGPTGRYWEPQDLLRRLRRIEGQARGVQALVARGARCKEIETQIAAMQGALNGVLRVVEACKVADAIEREVGPLDPEMIRRSIRRDVIS